MSNERFFSLRTVVQTGINSHESLTKQKLLTFEQKLLKRIKKNETLSIIDAMDSKGKLT